MTDRVVVSLLVGCALLGGVIIVELISDGVDTDAIPPVSVVARESGAPPRTQQPRADDVLATILARPLFSPSRQPAARETAEQPTSLDLNEVRLTGIVIEPERRLAIFAMPGARPMVRGEGETVSDWRLDSITPDAVELSGRAGSRTLRPKVDANLVRRVLSPRPGQPGAPAAGANNPRTAAPAPVPTAASAAAPPRPGVPRAIAPNPPPRPPGAAARER